MPQSNKMALPMALAGALVVATAGVWIYAAVQRAGKREEVKAAEKERGKAKEREPAAQLQKEPRIGTSRGLTLDDLKEPGHREEEPAPPPAKASVVEAIQDDERARSIRFERALLSKREVEFAQNIESLLSSGRFDELDKLALDQAGAGHFILRHWDLFDDPQLRGRLVKWADHSGVDQFIKNLGLQKSKNLRRLKIAFSLLDLSEAYPRTGPGGRPMMEVVRRGERQGAIRISEILRQSGARALDSTPGVKEFVQANPLLFEEAIADGTVPNNGR